MKGRKSNVSKLEDTKETCWKLIEKTTLNRCNTSELKSKIINESAIRWNVLPKLGQNYTVNDFLPLWKASEMFQVTATINATISYLSVRQTNKSSHWRCSVKRGVLRNFAKFTGKNMCQSLLFNKVATPAQVFSCEFCEILRRPILRNTSRRLLP